MQTFVHASMNLQIAVCLERCMHVAMCVQMLIYTACLCACVCAGRERALNWSKGFRALLLQHIWALYQAFN